MVDKPKSEKTAIAVHRDTVERLKLHMKYGMTVDGMVNKLLDSYEQINHMDTKIGATDKAEKAKDNTSDITPFA